MFLVHDVREEAATAALVPELAQRRCAAPGELVVARIEDFGDGATDELGAVAHAEQPHTDGVRGQDPPIAADGEHPVVDHRDEPGAMIEPHDQAIAVTTKKQALIYQ